MPTIHHPATHVEPRHEDRHVAILGAALDLVTEVGYDRVTMDAVATRARASKATIYRRWRGKADLVVEAVRHMVDTDAGPSPVEAIDEGGLRADLVAFVTALHEGVRGPIGDLIFGLVLAARRDEDLARALRERVFDDKIGAATADLVARAVARGELDASADPTVIEEVAPAVVILRDLQGAGLDADAAAHLVDHLLLPLLPLPSGTPPTRKADHP